MGLAVPAGVAGRSGSLFAPAAVPGAYIFRRRQQIAFGQRYAIRDFSVLGPGDFALALDRLENQLQGQSLKDKPPV